jgi:hypothetical protein
MRSKAASGRPEEETDTVCALVCVPQNRAISVCVTRFVVVGNGSCQLQ